MFARTANVLTAVGVAALAAACATEQVVATDPYSAVEFAGARQVYEPDRIAPKTMPLQTVGEGKERVVLVPEKYEGIAGSRHVHQRYPQNVAERLDGKCEGAVRVAKNENLVDVSDYCDVPVRALVSHNEYLDNTYMVEEGAFVRVPGADDLTRNGAAGIGSAGALFGEVTAAPGDTVETIAYRYNVSASAVRQLNPQLQWRGVVLGETLQVPVAAAEAVQAAPANPSLATGKTTNAPSTWQGYDAEPGDAGNEKGNGIVDSHMPYAMDPTDGPSRAATRDADIRLVADRRLVRQGGRVTVSMDGLPAGTDVTFYRGKNLGDMGSAKTVRVGPDGVASKSFRVSKKKSDMGGYVFMATRSDTGESYYSERVGVMKIKDPDALLDAGDDADDEEDEADEE